MDVKSRHHLRGDEIDEIVAAIEAGLGVTVEGDAFEDVELTDSDRRIVLVDGEPYIAFFDGEPFLTVVGAQQFDPQRHVVTVDAGAVSFVSDGADVMRPGVVEADEDITTDDLVAVAEETHGKVLAVGRALVDGAEMTGDHGKVVESLHHVGDELYEFSV